ncbi:GntR family transcriptional regulator [Vallitaleaceae bacterium 9-2]
MSKPIYQQLAKELAREIKAGVYKAGDRLPSERELARQYEVSRMTARQALKLLEQQSVVHREQGSGTYVKAPAFAQNNVGSFTETIGNMGYRARTKILELHFIYGLDMVARQLNLPPDTTLLKVKRLRYGDDIPMALETLYIPKIYCPNLEGYDLTMSLYKLLEEVYNIHVKRVSYTMEAQIANPIYAKIFDLNKTTALLKVSGVTIDQTDRKLFYEESLYRSDLYNYHVDIMRRS